MNNEEKIDYLINKIEKIEQIITSKIDPMVDLIQVLIQNGIKNCSENPETENNPELLYKEDENIILITGTKTYENKELIKSTFKDSSWDKQKSAWVFKKFEDYETVLLNVFPNIIKRQ